MKKFFLILSLFFVLSVNTQAEIYHGSDIAAAKKQFSQCADVFKNEQKECPDSWRMKCYSHLMTTNRNAQKCYKKIALNLFEKYYGLSTEEATEKVDNFSKFIYEQYLYIFSETDYCKQNNCGVSLYLYSEYTTTEELQIYVGKIIGSISSRN